MPVASILLALALSCGVTPPDPAAKSEAWDLTLPGAIRTALDNSETVRVIRLMINGLGNQAFEVIEGPDFDFSQQVPGVRYPDRPEGPAAAAKPVRIARLNPDGRLDSHGDPERFRSEVTALVLSVEEQYWTLWQHATVCRARVGAVLRARECVEREEARLADGRGTPQAVAAARESLEPFRRDLESATVDRDTAERRLRETLGLEPADGRHMVPATNPRTDLVKPDWEACFVRMFERHPDIVRQQRMVETAQVRLLVAKNLCLAAVIGETVPLSFGNGPAWMNVRGGQYQLSVERECLDQLLQERSRSLCRLMADLPQSFHEFQVAVEAREAADKQREEERVGLAAGRGSLERYLDAWSRWSLSVAEEARTSAAYNRALAHLDANQGMLLDAANIAVADGPKPRRPYARPVKPHPARDQK
jgi:hypothetical protein